MIDFGAPNAAGWGIVGLAIAISAVDVLLNRRVVHHLDRLPGVDFHRDLLAGRHWFRAGRHGIQRVHAPLRSDEVFLFRFAVPKRAQAQGVDAEDGLIAQPRDNSRGTLGEGTERLAQFGIHVVNLGRILNQVVLEGREDMLHRLDEIQTMAHAERVNRTVDILRIGTVLHHGDVEHLRFQTEARNRVELAIMLDEVEGLGALEYRIGVGAVTRMTHSD